MALFRKMDAQAAFLKMGIYGETSSGKTFTASQIAIGLAQYIAAKNDGKKPPVMFLDTETGSTWVRPLFEKAGIEFLGHASRAFVDLKQAVVEAEQAKAILIVDSMTHFWEEIKDAHLKAKKKRLKNEHARLELPDWNVIKPEWGVFTSAYLNSNAHIILLGRAGSIYEFQENEETHKKEMITAGTRMAAEKGMGYEPSILIEMTARQVTGPRKKKNIVRTATVLKDRSDILDGQQFDDPTFKNFLPHIGMLNVGGEQAGFDDTRSSEEIFKDDGNGRSMQPVRRRIVLKDIEDTLVCHIPGQGAADKKRKIDLLRKHFAANWVEIEELMPLDQLKVGLISLKNELEPTLVVDTTSTLDDEIPALAEDKPKVRVKANSGPSLKDTLKASLAITEAAE